MRLSRTPLYAESWNIAYRKCAEGTILHDEDTEFIVIPNNYRSWAADPFIFEYNENTYIFAELYDFIKGRGVIGYSKFSEGKFTTWKTILSKPYHLSYPYIFQHKNSIYMIPESGSTKKIIVYRAVKFPDLWEEKCVICEDTFVDTSFIEKENQFIGLTYKPGKNSKQYFIQFDEKFHLNYLIEQHQLEGKDARPGGRMYEEENQIIVITQDCNKTYGGGLLFFLYEYNDGKLVLKKSIKKLYPQMLNYSKNLLLDGIHTYSATKQYEVIDIKTRRLNLLNLLFRVFHKIKE